MNDVTIAIKTFERPESLKDLLISIRQFYPEMRVIVADDSKKPYAQEIARPFSNIECISLPFDVGVSAGRNELLFRIKSKYFVMCDDDNIFYEQTKLENFKKILDETDIELVGGIVMDKSAAGKFDEPNIYAGHFVLDSARNLRMEYIKPDKEVIRCDIVHQFFMAHTQAVLLKTGGWDPRLKLVDHADFFWTAKKSGLRVAFTPSVSVNHTGARPSKYIFYRTTRKNKYFLMHLKKIGVQSWTDGWATVTRNDVQPRWFKFIFQQKCIPWFITKFWRKLLQFIHLPPAFRRKKSGIPAVGEIDFGDFARLTPISTDWGLKRGGAIDRYYIENFLEKHAGDIKGYALEILNDNYLKRFGGARVKHRDILDVDANNPQATVIADLAKAEHLPADTYDCFILTQTLQLIYDLGSAIKHIYRILKPGGVLLATVPGISHFPHKTAPRHWSFTEYSLKTLLEEQFAKENIKTEIHGNVLVAASFLYGIGAGELKKEMYDYNDPDYQLVITAKAVK